MRRIFHHELKASTPFSSRSRRREEEKLELAQDDPHHGRWTVVSPWSLTRLLCSSGRFRIEHAVLRSLAVCILAAVVLGSACSKKPGPAPTPAASVSPSGNAARCAEVRARFKEYPSLMVEMEPSRLSGTFPRVSPARRDTSFTVSFVVDTAGKPAMPTFTVSKHVGARFTTELRKSVAGWRYSPASAEGCTLARKVSHTIDTRGRR